MLYTTHFRSCSFAALLCVAPFALATTFGCGGKVAAQTDNEGGSSASSSGSSSGGGSGSSDSSSGSDSSDAGGSDAEVECSLPPPSQFGGHCTMCNGEWYCPFPRYPQPSCPEGVQIYDPCGQDTSGCIECASDGAVTSWSCMQNQFVLGLSVGTTCSP